jgi:large subunit ribosomal protein L10
VLTDFAKEFEKPTIKIGLVDGRPVTADQVKRLASLPTKQVLLSQLAGTIQAPMAQFAGVLSGMLYQMVGALEALRAQRS